MSDLLDEAMLDAKGTDGTTLCDVRAILITSYKIVHQALMPD